MSVFNIKYVADSLSAIDKKKFNKNSALEIENLFTANPCDCFVAIIVAIIVAI